MVNLSPDLHNEVPLLGEGPGGVWGGRVVEHVGDGDLGCKRHRCTVCWTLISQRLRFQWWISTPPVSRKITSHDQRKGNCKDLKLATALARFNCMLNTSCSIISNICQYSRCPCFLVSSVRVSFLPSHGRPGDAHSRRRSSSSEPGKHFWGGRMVSRQNPRADSSAGRSVRQGLVDCRCCRSDPLAETRAGNALLRLHTTS